MKTCLTKPAALTMTLWVCSVALLCLTVLTIPAPVLAQVPAASIPPCNTGLPCVEFTSVPPYGSFEDLKGRVQNIRNPGNYQVCPYIRVEGGWWTKPTFATPCVLINPDRTWKADITTGGSDEKALEIVAFLLPKTVQPPQSSGSCKLPQQLGGYAKAIADRTGERTTISFSGYEWSVKDLFWGPGPNYFSDSTENVWVDEQGRLHLRITQQAGKWYTAEVVSKDAFGYGTYAFTVGGRVDQLNENVVLGLFTWDTDACETDFNEIDLEVWREQADNLNFQYVVQPFQTCGRFRFALPAVENLTHVFEWQPDRIRFRSLQGRKIMQSWDFTNAACIPVPVNGNARMNLWLKNGNPPTDGQEVEVVITHFLFIPSSP